MSIGKGKKRYTITLSESLVDRFQSLSDRLSLGLTVSALCEKALITTCDELQIIFEKGVITIDDLHRLIGREMMLIYEEENSNDQKRKKTSRSSKGIKRGN